MAAKKKIGRPTKYRSAFPEKASKLWMKGSTDEEVCKALKISHETLSQFEKRHPEFLAAKKTAKAQADELVEKSLFKRAMGYSHPDTHFSSHEGIVTATPMTKHYPPSDVACIFWLKNRKPKEWRDRSEVLLEQEIAGVDPAIVEALRKKFLETVTKP